MIPMLVAPVTPGSRINAPAMLVHIVARDRDSHLGECYYCAEPTAWHREWQDGILYYCWDHTPMKQPINNQLARRQLNAADRYYRKGRGVTNMNIDTG